MIYHIHTWDNGADPTQHGTNTHYPKARFFPLHFIPLITLHLYIISINFSHFSKKLTLKVYHSCALHRNLPPPPHIANKACINPLGSLLSQKEHPEFLQGVLILRLIISLVS